MNDAVSATQWVQPREPEFSPVVATIFDTLLSALHDGRLKPGDRVSDGTLAQEFNVSRTPVREAIQRLRDLGLLEAVAGQYTRVTQVTPEQIAHAMVVWMALYSALFEEIAGNIPDAIVEAMEKDHAEFVGALHSGDYDSGATYSFDFFVRPIALSANPILVSGIRRVVHLIRLGSMNLSDKVDLSVLQKVQAQLLEALRADDIPATRAAIGQLRHIQKASS